MIERTGHCTFVSISYERLSDYCPHCSMMGYSATNCKRQPPKDITSDDRRGRIRSCDKAPSKADKGKTKVTETSHKGAQPDTPTSLSNQFTALVMKHEQISEHQFPKASQTQPRYLIEQVEEVPPLEYIDTQAPNIIGATDPIDGNINPLEDPDQNAPNMEYDQIHMPVDHNSSV